MTAFLATCLTIFLGLLLAQLVYWHIVRPVILLKLRYSLFEIRDRLRLKVISKEIGAKQPAYKILEELCNSSIFIMEYAGLTVIRMARKNPAAILQVERNLEIIRESEQPLREIFDDISTVNVGIIICNSPGWIPWIIFCLLGSYLSQKGRDRIDQWKRGAMGMTYETT
jgi:hypothetical protein